jgi:hypothetical protein
MIHSAQHTNMQENIPQQGPFNNTMYVPASGIIYNETHSGSVRTPAYANMHQAEAGSTLPNVNIMEILRNYFDPPDKLCPNPQGDGAPRVDDRLKYYYNQTMNSFVLRQGQSIPNFKAKYSKHDSPESYEVQLNMKVVIEILIKRGQKIGLNAPKVRTSPGKLSNQNPLYSRESFDKNVKSWIDSVNDIEKLAFDHSCSPRQVLIFMTNPQSYKVGSKWNRIVTEQEMSELWLQIPLIGDMDDLGNLCQWLRIREWFSKQKDYITVDFIGGIKDKLNDLRVKCNLTTKTKSPLGYFSLYIHEASELYKKLPVGSQLQLPSEKVRNAHAALKRGAEYQMQVDKMNGIIDRDAIDLLVTAKIRDACEIHGYDPDSDYEKIWKIMVDFAEAQFAIHEAEEKRAKAIENITVTSKGQTTNSLQTPQSSQQSTQLRVIPLSSQSSSHSQHRPSNHQLPHKQTSPMTKFPQRGGLMTITPPQLSMKQHKDEAVSVCLAMKQYRSWDEVPIEALCLMHHEHGYRCHKEALEFEDDEDVLEADCYNAQLMAEFLQGEDADRQRCLHVYSLTPDASKDSWQQCKWCWVCGLNNHTYLNCPFRDFRSEYNLSTFKMKFQPDIMIDLILTACKAQGYLSKESGNTAITLRETIMRERADFLNLKKKALSDGSFKQMTSNGKYNNHYQPPVSA